MYKLGTNISENKNQNIISNTANDIQITFNDSMNIFLMKE